MGKYKSPQLAKTEILKLIRLNDIVEISCQRCSPSPPKT